MVVRMVSWDDAAEGYGIGRRRLLKLVQHHRTCLNRAPLPTATNRVSCMATTKESGMSWQKSLKERKRMQNDAIRAKPRDDVGYSRDRRIHDVNPRVVHLNLCDSHGMEVYSSRRSVSGVSVPKKWGRAGSATIAWQTPGDRRNNGN